MRSAKQIAASRANRARSKGPVTPEGKRNSSRNSTRHGMVADTLVLEKEDPTNSTSYSMNSRTNINPPRPPRPCWWKPSSRPAGVSDEFGGIQKTNFDYDIASITTTENPALCAVQALRKNDGSIRSHELLLRFEIALDRQISRALHRLQQFAESGRKTETRSA